MLWWRDISLRVSNRDLDGETLADIDSRGPVRFVGFVYLLRRGSQGREVEGEAEER